MSLFWLNNQWCANPSDLLEYLPRIEELSQDDVVLYEILLQAAMQCEKSCGDGAILCVKLAQELREIPVKFAEETSSRSSSTTVLHLFIRLLEILREKVQEQISAIASAGVGKNIQPALHTFLERRGCQLYFSPLLDGTNRVDSEKKLDSVVSAILHAVGLDVNGRTVGTNIKETKEIDVVIVTSAQMQCIIEAKNKLTCGSRNAEVLSGLLLEWLPDRMLNVSIGGETSAGLPAKSESDFLSKILPKEGSEIDETLIWEQYLDPFYGFTMDSPDRHDVHRRIFPRVLFFEDLSHESVGSTESLQLFRKLVTSYDVSLIVSQRGCHRRLQALLSGENIGLIQNLGEKHMRITASLAGQEPLVYSIRVLENSVQALQRNRYSATTVPAKSPYCGSLQILCIRDDESVSGRLHSLDLFREQHISYVDDDMKYPHRAFSHMLIFGMDTETETNYRTLLLSPSSYLESSGLVKIVKDCIRWVQAEWSLGQGSAEMKPASKTDAILKGQDEGAVNELSEKLREVCSTLKDKLSSTKEDGGRDLHLYQITMLLEMCEQVFIKVCANEYVFKSSLYAVDTALSLCQLLSRTQKVVQ